MTVYRRLWLAGAPGRVDDGDIVGRGDTGFGLDKQVDVGLQLGARGATVIDDRRSPAPIGSSPNRDRAQIGCRTQQDPPGRVLISQSGQRLLESLQVVVSAKARPRQDGLQIGV